MSLKELSAKKKWKSLGNLIQTWCLIFSSFYFFSLYPSLFTGSVLFLLVGTFVYHLNILGHDGIHFLLHDSRSINDVICRYLILGPQFVPLTSIRNNHLNHHRTLGTAEDADRHYYEYFLKNGKRRLLRNLILSFTGVMLAPIAKKLLLEGKRRKGSKAVNKNDIFSVLISQIFVALLIWSITDIWYAWFIFWVLPIFTVMVGLNTVRSCLEHADPGDVPNRNRSFISSPLERFFFAPFNMNFHAEHHTYPTVPYYNLPELRAWMLKGNKNPFLLERSYKERLFDLLRNLSF